MRIVVMVGLLMVWAGAAAAQPGCRDVLVPELAVGQAAGTADIVYAIPPTAAEPWGRVIYPIVYVYPTGANSVGLMTLTADTFRMPGWQVQRAGQAADPNKWYVLGQSNRWYEWVPDGLRFAWYHVPDVDGPPNVVTGDADWYRTLDVGDAAGLNTNLSVVLQRRSAVMLAVVAMYPYPEPIRVNVQMHARVC